MNCFDSTNGSTSQEVVYISPVRGPHLRSRVGSTSAGVSHKAQARKGNPDTVKKMSVLAVFVLLLRGAAPPCIPRGWTANPLHPCKQPPCPLPPVLAIAKRGRGRRFQLSVLALAMVFMHSGWLRPAAPTCKQPPALCLLCLQSNNRNLRDWG
jgi:hypothetical protein